MKAVGLELECIYCIPRAMECSTCSKLDSLPRYGRLHEDPGLCSDNFDPRADGKGRFWGLMSDPSADEYGLFWQKLRSTRADKTPIWPTHPNPMVDGK
jgi:hypothetical protein